MVSIFFKKRVVYFIVLALITAGCSVRHNPIEYDAILKQAEDDLDSLYGHHSPDTEPIDFYNAIARAIKHNLDSQIASQEVFLSDKEALIERLEMLPDLNGRAFYEGQDRPRAASSESLRSGQQSLEPSFSADTNRRTASLELSWNLLDLGLGYVRQKQDVERLLIQQEKQRKVIHEITQDLRVAYWQAYGAQEYLPKIDTLVSESNAILADVRTAQGLGLEDPLDSLSTQSRVLKKLETLISLKQNLILGKSELASLMNLPPQARFKLEQPEDVILPELKNTPAELSIFALSKRPEFREEMYRKRLTEYQYDEILLGALPGIETRIGQQYDSNSFLVFDNWTNFSAGLVKNFSDLFSLPARLDRNEHAQKISDLRRRSVAAGIVSQVHISLIGYDLARQKFAISNDLDVVNQSLRRQIIAEFESNTVSRLKKLEVELDSLIESLNKKRTYADLQNAYGRFLYSLGEDIIPVGLQDLPIEDMAVEIKKAMRPYTVKSLKFEIPVIRKNQIPTPPELPDFKKIKLKSNRVNKSGFKFKTLKQETSRRYALDEIMDLLETIEIDPIDQNKLNQ